MSSIKLWTYGICCVAMGFITCFFFVLGVYHRHEVRLGVSEELVVAYDVQNQILREIVATQDRSIVAMDRTITTQAEIIALKDHSIAMQAEYLAFQEELLNLDAEVPVYRIHRYWWWLAGTWLEHHADEPEFRNEPETFEYVSIPRNEEPTTMVCRVRSYWWWLAGTWLESSRDFSDNNGIAVFEYLPTDDDVLREVAFGDCVFEGSGDGAEL